LLQQTTVHMSPTTISITSSSSNSTIIFNQSSSSRLTWKV
jgi:hypothetical protein